MGSSVNVNSGVVVAALLLVHTIGPQAIMVLPAITQGYVEYRGASESFAGMASSLEAWGLSCAALSMMYLVSRVSWRKLMLASLVLFVISNVLSIPRLGDTSLLVFRFLAGFGGGIIVAVSYAMIGCTERPQRNFGLAITLVLIYAAIAFPLLAALYARWGLSGGFAFFAAFGCCAIPLVRLLPDCGVADVDVIRDVDRANRMEVVLGSACMLFYFIGVMGSWVYFYRFGVRIGLTEASVGNALSISQFAGIAGASLVVVLGHRLRPDVGAFLGILIGAMSIGFLAILNSFNSFLIVCLVFQFTWNLTHPLLLSLLAMLDSSGRLIAYGTGMQFLGVALGPSLAAVVVNEGSLTVVAASSSVIMVFSALAVIGVVRAHR